MKRLTKQTKPVKEKEIERGWHLIDVGGKVLGRVAPMIASLLQGKNKANYVPYLDMGDYVVVINASQVVVTGKKEETKIYTRYSGYPGGLKVLKYKDLLNDKPEFIIKHAVSGMLPKNKFRDRRLKRLFVFQDNNHPYQDKFNKK